MARTPSNMVKLGTLASEFSLLNPIVNKVQSYEELKGEKGTIVVFMCNHCPFVVHVIEQIVSIANEYNDKGISVVAINSNDVEHFPEDSPENMILFAEKYKMNFAYLYDETQEVAAQYDAACTPDFYLFDSERKLVYRGQLDDSRPGNTKVCDGKDLRAACELLLENKPQDEFQKPSLGCNIKWKSNA